MSEVVSAPAPPPVETRRCLNCEAPLTGPFCAACGQRDEPPDLPLKRILSDAAGDLFSFDGRVLQTARILIREPGRLSLDWAAGRRARHVAPFRLYLLCSLVFVALSAGHGTAKVAVGAESTETAEEDAQERREAFEGQVPAAKVEAVADYVDAMLALGSRWMFVLMPLGGFGLYVLFHIRRKAYTAHFVVAIHVFCVVILLLAARRVVQTGVVLAVGQSLSDLHSPWNAVLLLAAFLASYVYAALAVRRFYGVSTARAFAAAPAVTVGPAAAWLALFGVGMMLIIAWPA